MDNSTSNYYSRAMQKKKKCNLEPVFFTLIGRSVDTTVNGDRTNHPMFFASIVINAQKDEISSFERLNHDETC